MSVMDGSSSIATADSTMPAPKCCASVYVHTVVRGHTSQRPLHVLVCDGLTDDDDLVVLMDGRRARRTCVMKTTTSGGDLTNTARLMT